MTPATATPAKRESAEAFWAIFLRRTRYVLAVIVSGIIFHYLAMGLANPPAQYSGVSLLAWGQSMGVIAITLLSLCILTALSVIVSMAICHPDSPHAGMYCGLLGMAILSIRGGTSTLMLAVFQSDGHEASLYRDLALESILLIVIILSAHIITRLIYTRYFANNQWARRFVHTDGQFAELCKPGVLPDGAIIANDGSKSSARLTSEQWVGSVGALAVTMLVGSLLIYITVQSQAKGQVLFGAYASFLIAAAVAHLSFPKSTFLAYWLAVPLTIALGYYLSRAQGEFVIPGHASSAVARGVPLDYIAAGVPGAIHGVYMAMKWRVSPTLHEKA